MKSIFYKKYTKKIIVFLGIFAFATLLYVSTSRFEHVPLSEDCTGSMNSDFQCLKQHVSVTTLYLGPKFALNELQDFSKDKPDVTRLCHQLTHEIGNVAAANAGGINKMKEVFTAGTDICFSGYYHGVMEGYVALQGLGKLEENIGAFCADTYSSEKQFEYWNCVHGIGHGIMSLTHNALPKSLSLCDKYRGTWEKKRCYEGVFMENAQAYSKERSHYDTEYLRPDDLLYPCNAVETKYKSGCYAVQSLYVYYEKNEDVKALFDLCENAEANFRRSCVRSIGIVVTWASFEDTPRMIASCQLGKNDEQQNDCFWGVVVTLVRFFNSYTEANAFCGSLPERFTSSCLASRDSIANSAAPELFNEDRSAVGAL